jgi:hypothetical protein
MKIHSDNPPQRFSNRANPDRNVPDETELAASHNACFVGLVCYQRICTANAKRGVNAKAVELAELV